MNVVNKLTSIINIELGREATINQPPLNIFRTSVGERGVEVQVKSNGTIFEDIGGENLI